MKLADFIVVRQDAILAEWDAFAATVAPAAARMNMAALRDHAREMLDAIAADLAAHQTDDEQRLKSQGKAPVLSGAPPTAAQTHALQRARSGFDVNEMVAEYRALRASVLRLWAAEVAPVAVDLQDTIRFNEAVDQAIAESISYFSRELDRSRNLLLGVLGHDMRSPLQVVLLTAKHLGMLNSGTEVSRAASRLIRSGARMQALLDDLVDFNRSNLGVGIRISPVQCDLRTVFGEALDLLRAANPASELQLTCTGDLQGSWDPNRVHQVLGNLVTNAIKYGDGTCPVEVALAGSDGHVTFTVANAGQISSERIADLFEPLRQGLNVEPSADDEGSMGLGLYIAREIVRGHGGRIGVSSEASRTVFTVVLPRSS